MLFAHRGKPSPIGESRLGTARYNRQWANQTLQAWAEAKEEIPYMSE